MPRITCKSISVLFRLAAWVFFFLQVLKKRAFCGSLKALWLSIMFIFMFIPIFLF